MPVFRIHHKAEDADPDCSEDHVGSPPGLKYESPKDTGFHLFTHCSIIWDRCSNICGREGRREGRKKGREGGREGGHIQLDHSVYTEQRKHLGLRGGGGATRG